MRNYIAYSSVFSCLALVGCTTTQQVATPSDVTVKAAILELADSFYEAQQRGEGRPKVGLIVDEATVEFNVAAKASSKWNTGAEAGGMPLNSGTLKLAIANESFSEGTRSNKVIVKFKNLATASVNKDGLAFLRECLNSPNKRDCSHIIMMQPAN